MLIIEFAVSGPIEDERSAKTRNVKHAAGRLNALQRDMPKAEFGTRIRYAGARINLPGILHTLFNSGVRFDCGMPSLLRYLVIFPDCKYFDAHVQNICGVIDVCLGSVLEKFFKQLVHCPQPFHTLSASLPSPHSYIVACSLYAHYHYSTIEEILNFPSSAVMRNAVY